MPLDDLARTPLLVITSLAAVLGAAGYAGLRRRDINC
jgi:putative exporter of polyketide antibiotics